MESPTYQTGTIITDGEVKWTPFSDDSDKPVEKLGVIEHSLYSVALVLIGIVIGTLCK